MNINQILTAGYAEVRRAKTNHDKNMSTTLITSTFMFLNFLIFLCVLCALVSTAVFGIKRLSRMAILAAAPLLMAALWMDKQPSPKPYQAPILASPVGSVPVSGKEIVSQGTELKNPFTPTVASLVQGKAIFAINCAMCHGQTSAERGPVGRKLKPPPPALDHDLVRERSDAHIFKAITFGFGRMPPFKDKLSPRERWDLVNFLRTRK